MAIARLAMLLLLSFVAASNAASLIVFGDSTVDTGTNFHTNWAPFNFQANRYPYGYKAFSGEPTGRFTEGRVIVDFIAELAGMPPVEPFIKPGATFTHGVNFGSGGAGALIGTNQGMVIPLTQQLENFNKFSEVLSKDKNIVEFEEYISDGIYLISIGSNDYLSGYFSTPELQKSFTPEEFVYMVVSNITRTIEFLHSKGARKFVLFGVGPLGCLPPLRIINGTGGCFEMASALGRAHNYALNLAVERLRQVHPDSTIVRAHFYEFFDERQNNHAAYGFKEPVQACCGAGPFRGRGHCGVKTEDPETSYELCELPEDHIWWDPYHPAEKVHQQYAEALWSGNRSVVEPINLRQLFQSSHSRDQLENPASFPFDEL